MSQQSNKLGRSSNNGKTRTEVQTTKVFQLLLNSKKRINVFQGSSRASKTYNILIYFVYRLLQEDNKVLTLVRKTLPALKGSILRDLKEVLELFGVYSEQNWHTVDGYYKLGTNLIEWMSVDDETKVRGRKRDYLFINEATEVNYDEFIQLLLRTSDLVVLDLNPSLWKSWIYDLEGRDDTNYHIVTYKDNPFLPETQRQEIEKLQDRDPNLWRIFGLGLKGVPTKMVFTHYQLYYELPQDAKLMGYGIDWGYSDPSTLVAVYKNDNGLYVKELLYLKNVTIPDFIYKIKDLELNVNDDFIADSANPQAIEELRRNGINCKPVKKNSILHGIDLIKRNNFYVDVTSKNLQEELQSYVWKSDKNGNNLDEPVDDANHLLDGIRYVLEMKLNRNHGVYVY
jgi:phage terminase large subunit